MIINPKMLKMARHSRGMPLADLALKSGVNKAILSKIETGLTIADNAVLNKLSKALGYPISFFSLELSEARYSDFFYRKRVTMPVKEKEKIDAQIDIMRLMYDGLIASAEIPEPKLFSVSPKKGISPEQVARMARDFYGIAKGPILNLINRLEKNGIGIVYLDTESEKFDGVTTYTDKGHPLIVLNKNKPNDRKRFTLAHELGHIIMHFPFRFENDFYERLKDDKDNVFENEADRFASEFLMPTEDIFGDLSGLTYSKLSILKQYWNVSKSSIVRKAKTLKCIDEKKYGFLMIELSRNGERKNELSGITIDEPQVLKKLFEVHTGELQYTNEELANHLYISPDDLTLVKAVHNGNRLRIAV